MFPPVDLHCHYPVKKQAKPEGTGRPVVVAAFGRYLKKLRDDKGWSQEDVVDLLTGVAKVSGTSLSHAEQGKTTAPDPVLLLDLAKIYGVNLKDLVELLRRNRQMPTAATLSELSRGPAEDDMVVRGEERAFVDRVRKLQADQRYALMTFLHALESGYGAAAPRAEATFRGTGTKRKHR